MHYTKVNGTMFPDDFLGKESSYHYLPTLWICALILALYSISTIAHLLQACYYRTWYCLPTLVLGGCGEVIGWSARLWSSINILTDTPFMMQISTTIISPTFLSAANFLILGQVVDRVGPEFSRLSPKYYSIIFITVDVFALVIQAAGGGIASSAATDSDAAVGANIMLAGIVIQLVAITIYVILAGEFLHRVFSNRPIRSRLSVPNNNGDTDSNVEKPTSALALSRNIKLMMLSLGASSLFLFIRAIYRTIELSGGWTGRIIETQHLFNILDGAMVVLAIYTLNFLHPGYLLGPRHSLPTPNSP